MALSLGQQHVPCVERPAVAGGQCCGEQAAGHLFIPGPGPWARARPPGQAAASQARGGVGDPALGEVISLQESWLLLREEQVIRVLRWGIQ